MVYMQLVWLIFILTFITSGMTQTATVLYALSIFYFIYTSFVFLKINKSIEDGDKTVIPSLEMMYDFYPIGIKNVIPVTCSAMAHGFFCLVFLSNPLLSVAIVVVSMFRIHNSIRTENLICQK